MRSSKSTDDKLEGQSRGAGEPRGAAQDAGNKAGEAVGQAGLCAAGRAGEQVRGPHCQHGGEK